MKSSNSTEILTRKNIITAIIIVVVSSLIGIIYNFLLPKPLDFIYTPKKVEVVSDTLLFNNNQSGNTTQQKENLSKNIEKINNEVNSLKEEKNSAKTKDTAKLTEETTKVKEEIPKNDVHKFHFVSYEQMKKILNQKDFLIIDARQPDSYNNGHIPGAINIFALDDPNVKVPKIFDLPTNKKIVVYCDGGACDLSEELAKELVGSFGFKDVFVYAGGWAEWEQKEKN